MTRGKLVLVSFPFDDQTSAKVRPALCLTDPIGPHRHVVLAFVSSRSPDELLPTDLRLEPGLQDFASTGLRMPSVLRLHRLLTVPTSVIRRELGVLPSSLQTEVDGRLRRLFRLA